MKLALVILFVALWCTGAAAQEDTPPLSPALVEQLDALETYTERARGLTAAVEVERDFPTRQELIDYLEALYSRDLVANDLQHAEQLYIALGMLPPGTNLREVYLRLLSSQVAGFYDTETKVMNVIPMVGDDTGESLSLTEQIIYVHEYTHALQDQNFGLGLLLEDEAIASQPDRSLATLALIEGDATAIMNLYMQSVTARNPLAALRLLVEGLQAGNLVLPDDIPAPLVRELMFPYEDGFSFVLAVYADGGWDAINAAYDNLPQTSEQILHPEKYLAGEVGIDVTLDGLDAALEGWTRVWDIRLGEFYLREHLRSGLSRSVANRAAAGWGGDAFQLYTDRETGAVAWGLRIEWDTAEDAAEFTDAYTALNDARFESEAVDSCWSDDALASCLIVIDGGHLVVQAPTLTLAQGMLLAEPEA